MLLRAITTLTCSCLLATAALAQQPMGNMKMDQPAGKALPSPKADASVKLNGKDITIHYNAPSVRGRKIMGEVVPYGKVWRTGANEATTLVTAGDLKIGTLTVPAGTYTLYTLPSANHWQLIVNKQTGQWGTEYKQDQDLGRVDMQAHTLPTPQEVMSISFQRTRGNTTELHIKWETTDASVPITAE